MRFPYRRKINSVPTLQLIRFSLVVLLCALTLSACTAASLSPRRPVMAGERILIDYTCRTADGALAATSSKATAEDQALPHSPLFAPLNNYLPASETAPNSQQSPQLSHTMCFEEMLEMLLARQAVGAPLDTPQTFAIEGELIPGISGGDRYLTMNRSFQKKRRVTIPTGRFEEKFKTPPVPGKTIAMREPGLSVTVEAVDGDKAVFLYNAEPGAVLPSPFGPGIITQTTDAFEVKTDAKVGTIIRSGGMIGKITGIDETSFVVDYGHSSGFTPLTCEVVFKPFASPDGQDWYDNINQAREESRRTGRPLLIHFHDQWDSASRTFLATILPDPKVVAATSGYIRVRINSLDRISMLREYQLVTMPSVLIFDSEGKELQRFIGPSKADEFADGLKKILALNEKDTEEQAVSH